MKELLPKIRKTITDSVKATHTMINPDKHNHVFEIIGYDFMIDDKLKVYLIEANTNPCLELSAPLLARIIPSMLETAFRIAIDPIFGIPPEQRGTRGKRPEKQKWELIFDDGQLD